MIPRRFASPSDPIGYRIAARRGAAARIRRPAPARAGRRQLINYSTLTPRCLAAVRPLSGASRTSGQRRSSSVSGETVDETETVRPGAMTGLAPTPWHR